MIHVAQEESSPLTIDDCKLFVKLKNYCSHYDFDSYKAWNMLLAQGYCLGSCLGKNEQGVAKEITYPPQAKIDIDERIGLGCILSKLQCKLRSSQHQCFNLGGIQGFDHQKISSKTKGHN
ncbi:hypothetical protein AMTR_s00118p00140870 [Amborella trichopoda]|uniref:G-patch domain-containing protein n=1 Tax=Amborella trichopoda TaxID=13333 RepID=W1NSR1_AMBTC|nr:hypothetical protein AMTR_s00118p00140870 [Amborella trichopoda]